MKTVVILSGGLDSTVLLHHEKRAQEEVSALSFDYGQRHAKELVSARAACAALGVHHQVVDLRGLKPILSGSSLTSDDVPVPEGHYASPTMKATVVPNRNMIMLSVAVGYAISRGARRVSYAAHAGDHAIYPDCRPEFVEALAGAVLLCDWENVILAAPFITWRKEDIVIEGKSLGVPMGETWSCYKGGELHCAKCGTCVERIEAFERAGVVDPTVYA